MRTAFPQADKVRAQLEQLGSDFICTSCLPDTSASVLFLGQFQGHTVAWNMTVATLVYYRLAEADVIATTEPRRFVRPFIDIEAERDGVYQLNVGLDLPVIDEAVIKKTLIMIRNYKRLVIGRIEFGTACA
jgi:hypothetical protein